MLTPIENWQEALDRIYGLANWETRPPGTLPSFELDRIRELLASLGEPQRRFKAVHVAGTNGKGSTSAMIEAGLRASGLKTGLFTSPHLHSLRERIQVSGELVGEDWVIAWLNRNAERIDALPALTTFELLTAMAFDCFAECEVDLAVIEVGLGGRLDTTNVLEPELCVFTPIGMDHAAVLGDTIGQIAADKAGIIKPGVPVVSASQDAEAMAQIVSRSAELDAPLWRCDEAVELGDVGLVMGRMRVNMRVDTSMRGPLTESSATGRGAMAALSEERVAASPESTSASIDLRVALFLPLIGRFQVENACSACLALAVLAQRGWPVDKTSIEQGLAATEWPGRFERFFVEPDGPTFVVDGAHNPPAARALAESLDWCFGDAPRRWILGFSGEKDLGSILEALGLFERGEAPSILAVAADHPRALSAEAARTAIETAGIAAEAAGSPADALALAVERADPGDVIVATGSIFVAADARMAWFEQAGGRIPESDPPAEG